MFNIKNENPKAVEIGMQQLKTFMKCANFSSFKLTSVTELVGHKCAVVVKIKSDSYGDKSTISYYKPFNVETVEAAPVKKSNPF